MPCYAFTLIPRVNAVAYVMGFAMAVACRELAATTKSISEEGRPSAPSLCKARGGG